MAVWTERTAEATRLKTLPRRYWTLGQCHGSPPVHGRRGSIAEVGLLFPGSFRRPGGRKSIDVAQCWDMVVVLELEQEQTETTEILKE